MQNPNGINAKLQARLRDWGKSRTSHAAHKEVSPYINALQRAAISRSLSSTDDRLVERSARQSVAAAIARATQHSSQPLADKSAMRMREARAQRAKRLRPYENPLLVSLLEELAEQLIAPRRDFPGVAQKHIFVTCIQSGRFNGRVIRVRENQYIIIIDSGLPTYLYNFAHCLAWAIPKHDDGRPKFDFSDEDAGRHMATHQKDVISRLATASLEYAAFGVAWDFPPSELPPHTLGFFRTVGMAAIKFVLGHEITHITLGHLDQGHHVRGIVHQALPAMSNAERQMFDRTTEIEMNSIRDEFDADRFTLSLMAEAEDTGRAEAAFGAWAFFAAMELLERTLGALEPTQHTVLCAGTHPSTQDRLMHSIRQFHPDEYETGELRALKGLSKIMDVCWSMRLRENAVAQARGGFRVHPMWHATRSES